MTAVVRPPAASLLCLALASAGCGGARADPASPGRGDRSAGGAVAAPAAFTASRRLGYRLFAASSIWNQPVPDNVPLDPDSAEIVAAFSAQLAAEQAPGHWPWINTTSSSVPVYTVGRHQPTVRVTLDHPSRSAALQAAWNAVPLPPDARPAAGNEKVLVVVQPSRDRLWEFWRMSRGPSGWHATWGGAMRRVSENPGVYGPRAWPGAETGWGVSASSLELLGGLIRLEDLARGKIDHALAIAIPNVRAGVFASPAQRTDGRSPDPLALPEGAHLRLDPRLNLASLHLPRLTTMIAQAAQRYGLIVRDYSPNLAFYAQDPTPSGVNPYTGPHGYFEGRSPRELLAGFPWSSLQLLPMQLHANGSATGGA